MKKEIKRNRDELNYIGDQCVGQTVTYAIIEYQGASYRFKLS